ncbi:ABC transporter substrate-binding protein [Vibrio lamellibrachiae]|uniref:ABC transporter substrate-binding protein n=1 Tax=Vibrio lamellibrachiae TaxID=2910253 RepID=UPI003D129885
MNSPKFIINSISCAVIIGSIGSVLAKEDITIWYENAEPRHQQALQDTFITPFNNSQDEYNVKIEYYGDVGVKTQMALMASQDTFDIFMTEGPTILKRLVTSRKVEPLDEYAKKYGWTNKYQEVMMDSLKVDNTLYGLPKTFESLGVFYNKKMFKDNNWDVPTTKSELESLKVKVREAGYMPFAAGNKGWQGNNEHYVSAIQASCLNSQQFHDVLKGKIKWSSPEVRESFDIVDDWFKESFTKDDYFSLNIDEMIAGMEQEVYPMTISGTWAFQFIKEEHRDNIGVAPLPALCSDSTYPNYSIAIGAAFSINANSKNKDGAAFVLDKLLSKETFVDMASVWPGEWLVPLEELPLDAFKENVHPAFYEHVTEVVNAMDVGNIGLATWTFFPPRSRQFIIENIEAVWLEKMTMDKFVNDLDKTFQRELKRGEVPTIPAPVGS